MPIIFVERTEKRLLVQGILKRNPDPNLLFCIRYTTKAYVRILKDGRYELLAEVD
jgi:hypothetical protein